jgi:Glycosyl hydrolases family 39
MRYLTLFLTLFSRFIPLVAMTLFPNLVHAEPPSSLHEPVPLGKLDAFWRYSAGLGPVHEKGNALYAVPQILLTGSFPYRKRPFPKEALFADHLSLVRILGGFNDGSDIGTADTAVRERDLAWRDETGKIRHRFELLRPRLQPYLDNGYDDLTIVLDNVPWCFPEKPGIAKFGQRMPPRDTKEWRDFISAFCNELISIMGREKAGKLRFRVGTENGGRERFDGSHDDYVRHYDASAAAVSVVLPEAKFGCYNISGVSLKGVRTAHNVRPIELAEHCVREANSFDGRKPTPFDWVAYSRYFRPGDKALDHARTCQEVWEAFEQTVPELRGISREIHEFGVAPWGEVKQDTFASNEPGALGTALTCQMMLRLREVGIRRLWHWGVLDQARGVKGQLCTLPTGNVWLMSVLEYMRDGESFLLPAPDSPTGTCHLALMSRTAEADIFLASAYNSAIADHTASSVVFRLPAALNGMTLEGARHMRLDRTTSIHDRIRRELGQAGHLRDEYIDHPERLGLVREMSKDGAGNRMVADHSEQYYQQWTECMTLLPITDDVAAIGKDGATTTLTVTMTPPELLVISIPRTNR